MSRIPRQFRANEPAGPTNEPRKSTNEPADSTIEPTESRTNPTSDQRTREPRTSPAAAFAAFPGPPAGREA
jgi:hypothetical protein